MKNLIEIAKRIGAEVAAVHADDVDRQGRFPIEAVNALKAEGLMGAYVPVELGGLGATVKQLSEMSEELGRHCASTAMTFAMHHIQIGCMVHHAFESEFFKGFLRDCAEKQLLVASMTSEVGVGGDMRSSKAALLKSAAGFEIEKHSTTMSYSNYADAYLITARRDSAAPANDQVLVLVKREDCTLEFKGVWDTMGLRGTCSPPVSLKGTGALNQVIDVPFSEISSLTMVPFAHMVWSGCWLGTAGAAIQKAQAFVRAQARAKPGSIPPTALRLAELSSEFHLFRTSVEGLVNEYQLLSQDLSANKEMMSSIPYALKMNNMKISGADILPQYVIKALSICGVMGYKNDSKFSMNRHLRDSLSAGVMVANDRILATNASMMLVLKKM